MRQKKLTGFSLQFNPPLAPPKHKLSQKEMQHSRKAFGEFIADVGDALMILGYVPEGIVKDYIRKDPVGSKVGLRIALGVAGATNAIAQEKETTDADS